MIVLYYRTAILLQRWTMLFFFCTMYVRNSPIDALLSVTLKTPHKWWAQGDHSFRKINFYDFSMTFQDQPKQISMTYRHYIFPEINETLHMNTYQNW